MDVKEKREKLNKFCDDMNCNDCVLKNNNKKYGYCYSEPLKEEIVNENYEIVFGNKVEKSNDPVNRPSHYTDGKIEVIDFIEDKKLGFCLGNAIKYIARAGKKDPTKEVEDLNKAKWYVERRIKELEEGIA